MDSQPQNPECRINPENFHPCILNFLISGIKSDSLKKLKGTWVSGCKESASKGVNMS